MVQTVKATVIGANEVAGARPGEIVELDPETVVIQALIDGGHIRLLPPQAAETTAPPPAPAAE